MNGALSGAYRPKIYCIFRGFRLTFFCSDPFVSFEGRDRFIANLANLGSFITKYSVKTLEFEESSTVFVKTKVRMSRL